LEKEYHVTSTGIKIGGGYIPTAKPMSKDEETIQDFLLGQSNKQKQPLIEKVLVAVYFVAVVVMLLDFFVWRP